MMQPDPDAAMLPRVWICPECRSIYNDPVGRCPRDEAPVAEVQAHQTKARYPLLGKVVGDRYHLIGGLGQGGLGTVYLAQHLHLEQLFAVKFLDLETLGVDVERNAKDTYRRDFMKEARVASLIRHESVVRVSDFGEHEGLPFLVMEYVPGPSLLQLMGQKGRLDAPEAINIARRIAEALDAFHERRLVHRDLKPANVILDPRGNGRLTLVDLGLVKDLSGPGGKASTHPMALRGTPGYLAPEQVPAWVLSGAGVQASGDKAMVDARVDIYALGVILYEMLAGVSPYPDGSNTAVIIYACTKDPIPFGTVRPPLKLLPGLDDLVYDTMARDPDRRPQSAAQFLDRLDQVAMGPAFVGSWPSLVVPGAGRRPPSAPQGSPPSLETLGGLAGGDDGDDEEAATAVFPSEASHPGDADSLALAGPQVFERPPGDEEATMEAGADSFDGLLDRSGSLDDPFLDEDEDATRRHTVPSTPATSAASTPTVRPISGGRDGGAGRWLLASAALLAMAGVAWWLARAEPRRSTPRPTVVAAADQGHRAPGPDATAARIAIGGPTADAVATPAPDAAVPDAAPPPPDAAPPPPDAAPPPVAKKRPKPRWRPKPKPKPKPPATSTADAEVKKGHDALQRGDYETALVHYERFLRVADRRHPERAIVHDRLPRVRSLVRQLERGER
jgi:serine/threonine protein kinase